MYRGLLAVFLTTFLLPIVICQAVEVQTKAAPARREMRRVAGWQVHVDIALLKTQAEASQRALVLLEKQLTEIVRVVPKPAVGELQKVPLYFSPAYPGEQARAEYHPSAGWLREHGRDPAMAKGVEFTNISIFEQETDRMPNFALHELAHAYHDRVLPKGFDNADVRQAYDRAKASGKYERVECWHGSSRPTTIERSYALSNPMEYFAEDTEAFFSRNDFFPFTRVELRRHDPEMFALLMRLWGVRANP